MQFLYKILALITLVISFIMAVLIAANLESIRAIGVAWPQEPPSPTDETHQ